MCCQWIISTLDDFVKPLGVRDFGSFSGKLSCPHSEFEGCSQNLHSGPDILSDLDPRIPCRLQVGHGPVGRQTSFSYQSSPHCLSFHFSLRHQIWSTAMTTSYKQHRHFHQLPNKMLRWACFQT